MSSFAFINTPTSNQALKLLWQAGHSGTCYLGSRQRNLETFVLHRNASVPELPETDLVDAPFLSLVAFEFNISLDSIPYSMISDSPAVFEVAR